MYRCRACGTAARVKPFPTADACGAEPWQKWCSNHSCSQAFLFCLNRSWKAGGPQASLSPQGQVHSTAGGRGSTQIPSLPPGDLLGYSAPSPEAWGCPGIQLLSQLCQECWLWLGRGRATWTPRDKTAKGFQHCSGSYIQKHISRGLLYLQGESHESDSNRG